MSLLRFSLALVVLVAGSPVRSDETSGFVFGKTSVTSTLSADFHIALGDPYTASFIKSRFPGHRIEFSDECEMECFVVSRGDAYLNVHGIEGKQVSALVSFSDGVTDHLGNRVGMPLRVALKSDSGVCLYEESIVCHTSDERLTYFAGGDPDCEWVVNWDRAPGAYVAIPECATLGGIEIRAAPRVLPQ